MTICSDFFFGGGGCGVRVRMWDLLASSLSRTFATALSAESGSSMRIVYRACAANVSSKGLTADLT